MLEGYTSRLLEGVFFFSVPCRCLGDVARLYSVLFINRRRVVLRFCSGGGQVMTISAPLEGYIYIESILKWGRSITFQSPLAFLEYEFSPSRGLSSLMRPLEATTILFVVPSL